MDKTNVVWKSLLCKIAADLGTAECRRETKDPVFQIASDPYQVNLVPASIANPGLPSTIVSGGCLSRGSGPHPLQLQMCLRFFDSCAVAGFSAVVRFGRCSHTPLFLFVACLRVWGWWVRPKLSCFRCPQSDHGLDRLVGLENFR